MKNNEVFGISAEKTICEVYNLEYPSNFDVRSSQEFIDIISPEIKNIFSEINQYPISYNGSNKVEIDGKKTTDPVDFYTNENKSISLKTNIKNYKASPPQIGQMTTNSCKSFLAEYIKEQEFTPSLYKQIILDNIAIIFKKMLKYMFDTDYTLWIYLKKGNVYHNWFPKGFGLDFNWDPNLFSFSKNTIEKWNEGTTLRYNGITIGEFQVHNHRDCYKFRFNLMNLYKIVKNEN